MKQETEKRRLAVLSGPMERNLVRFSCSLVDIGSVKCCCAFELRENLLGYLV